MGASISLWKVPVLLRVFWERFVLQTVVTFPRFVGYEGFLVAVPMVG